jgi:hypothetical protein
MQFDGLQNSIPEDAAQKRQRDVLVKVVRGWRSLLAILRSLLTLLTLPLGRPLSRCQLTVGTQHVPQIVQKGGNNCLWQFARYLGQMSALQGMLELTDRFLTVPGVSTAIQQVDDLRDG